MSPDLALHEAQALLAAHTPGPAATPEILPLPAAAGCILARDLISPINVPAHNNSAMDGYAFASALLPQASNGAALTLRVVGTALAGRPWTGAVPAGCCLRIMTGAVVPETVDTVVPHELVHSTNAAGQDQQQDQHQEEHIILPPATLASLTAGANVRLAGEDLAQGQVALRQGQRLHAAALGLAASLGLAELPVTPRLRVAYFSTGDEILSLGEAPRPGAVYDSNRYTILGMLRTLGVETIDLGAIADNPTQLRAAFTQAAAQADVVITSGGVSTGTADHTQALMQELGEVAFWRLALRPGRPFAFGKIIDKSASNAIPASADRSQKQSTLLFGLPGNPVAAMVCFLTLVRPALLQRMGASASAPLSLSARASHAIKKRPGRTEILRAVVEPGADGVLTARTTGAQGSGLLHSMVQANALLQLEHERGNVAAGEWVNVWLLDGLL